MAQDPGTDRGTLLEHQGLGESLRNLTHSILPDADRSLGEENPSRAARVLDQAIAELERMAQLSAEALRAQTTHRLLRDQSDLSNRAENLTRSLAYHVGAVALAAAGLVNPLVAAVLMPLSSGLVIFGALRVERAVAKEL